MGLIELLTKIGDAKLHVQFLRENLTNVTRMKKEMKVEFLTTHSNIAPQDLLKPGTSEWVGIVVWVPRKELPDELKELL